MKNRLLAALVMSGIVAACQPQLPFAGDTADVAPEQPTEAARSEGPTAEPARAADPPAGAGASGIDLQALAQRPRGEETICQTFARKIAESALRHGNDVEAFLGELHDEFIGGAENPFDMKRGLNEGKWNRRYFYAGHGGFRPEYDDAQRYPRGGNHQPGHFISVLSVAAQFGEEQARIAIAVAGDYDPGDEDDLRLSLVAIPLGAGLQDGSVTPAEVAQRARQLCR
jgi:hypothetical protein